MKLFLLRFALAIGTCAVCAVAAAGQEPAPVGVLNACKNEVGTRYPNIPTSYVSVDQASKTANGNYMVKWRTRPPGEKGGSGLCVVDTTFYVLRFEASEGPEPGAKPTMLPENALRTCRNRAADRLRIVPLEDITVERANDAADGSYVIKWREGRSDGAGRSGFCKIAPDGKVLEFEFDKPLIKP